MIGKGEFECEVSGKKIGFKFDMYANSITEKESGLGISQVFKKIEEGLTTLVLYYFYGGYVSYCRNKNVQPETINILGDYLEQIGFEKLTEIYTKSLGVYSKNDPAPEKAGPTSE